MRSNSVLDDGGAAGQVGGVLTEDERHPHGEDVIGAISGVDAIEQYEAAQHESRAGHQDYGDCHLGDDQRIAQSAAGGRPGAAALFETFGQPCAIHL